MNYNAKLVFFHKALYEVYFYGILVIPFFVSKGYSVSTSLSLISVYLLFSIFLEVPTGTLGDRFGHKASVVAGALLTSSAFFGFLIYDHILWDLFCLIILSTGAALNSGSDIALLKQVSESLSQDNRRFEYLKNIMLLVSFGSSGFLAYHFGLDKIIGLTGLTTLASAVPLLFIRNDVNYKTNSAIKLSYLKIFKSIPKALNKVDGAVMLIILLSIGGGISATSKEITSSLNIVYSVDIRTIGYLAALLMLARMIGTYIEQHIRVTDKLILATLAASVGLISTISWSVWSGVIFLFVSAIVGHALFYRTKYELTVAAPDTHIASLLSLATLSRRLTASLLLFTLGMFASDSVFHIFFVILSLVIILIFGLLIIRDSESV